MEWCRVRAWVGAGIGVSLGRKGSTAGMMKGAEGQHVACKMASMTRAAGGVTGDVIKNDTSASTHRTHQRFACGHAHTHARQLLQLQRAQAAEAFFRTATAPCALSACRGLLAR